MVLAHYYIIWYFLMKKKDLPRYLLTHQKFYCFIICWFLEYYKILFKSHNRNNLDILITNRLVSKKIETLKKKRNISQEFGCEIEYITMSALIHLLRVHTTTRTTSSCHLSEKLHKWCLALENWNDIFHKIRLYKY